MPWVRHSDRVLSVPGCPSGLINGWLGPSIPTLCAEPWRMLTRQERRPVLELPPRPCVHLQSGHRVLSQTLWAANPTHPTLLCLIGRQTQKEAFLKNVPPSNSKPLLRKSASRSQTMHVRPIAQLPFYSLLLYTVKCQFRYPRFQSKVPWETQTAAAST